MSDKFQKAKDCLKVQDVFLRSGSHSVSEDFDPLFLGSGKNLITQGRRSILKRENLEIEPEEEGDAKTLLLMRVFVGLGIRLVDKTTLNKKNDDKTKVVIHAEINAVFVAEYSVTDEHLSEDAMDEFARRNVIYHVWPFWREYVANLCTRMNLPKMMMPTIQV